MMLLRKSGASSSRPVNSRWPITSTRIGVVAVTLALRGIRSIRAISPNTAPGPIVATSCPPG